VHRPSVSYIPRHANKETTDGPPQALGRQLGRFAAAITMPVGKITDEWFFVSGIDVLASHETGGVEALGDVIDLALFD
jgi:hypothetical protein